MVPFRTSGEKPALFCACAGGGDALDYRDLALALPADQPVYAFGLPDLGGSQQFPTVQELAAIYVRKVRERQEQGPYRLCGHSFGGLVVYEMAVLLENAGLEVDLLALLDTLHPRTVRAFQLVNRRSFNPPIFLTVLLSMGGIWWVAGSAAWRQYIPSKYDGLLVLCNASDRTPSIV